MADTAQPSQADYDKLVQENGRLQAALDAKTVSTDNVDDADLTPTPTQAELDRLKRGETADGKPAVYKTRQAKAG